MSEAKLLTREELLVLEDRVVSGDFDTLVSAFGHALRHLAAVEEERERDVETVPHAVHEHGWQWRPTSPSTAFAPPLGTIRACDACGVLVAGGPTRCIHCVRGEAERESLPERDHDASEARERIRALEAERDQAHAAGIREGLERAAAACEGTPGWDALVIANRLRAMKEQVK